MSESAVNYGLHNPAPRSPPLRRLNVFFRLDLFRPVNENRSGWALNSHKEASEANGSFHASIRPFEGSTEIRALTAGWEHGTFTKGRWPDKRE